MTNQEILDKIATLEKGISNPSVPESAKATLKTKIEALKAQIEKVEEKLEQKEEKLEQKEEKVQNELEEKISKLERGINNPNVPESAKAALRKKLADAKEELSSQKKEIAEDKKEAKQEMKEVKEAVKDLEKAAKSQRKTPIKKPVIKEKERAVKSEKRTAKLKSLLTGLDAIVEKNKALKEKYKGKGVDLKKDAGRPAKPFGYRFVGKHDYRKPSESQIKAGLKRGTIDYEARPNRSDKYPKGYKGSIKLEDGGMAKGGDTTLIITQREYTKTVNKLDEIYGSDINKDYVHIYDLWNAYTELPEKDLENLFGNDTDMIIALVNTFEKNGWNVDQPHGRYVVRQGYKGGMMAKGGEAGQITTAKYYWNTFDKQKRIDFLIGAGYSKSVANDLSSESWSSLEEGVHKDLRAVLMADGGMMAKGGKPKDLPVVRTQFEEEEFEYARGGVSKGVKHYSVDIDLENGDNVRDLEYKSLDKAKAVYEKYKKEMIYKGEKIDDIQLIKVLTNGDYESVGNQMARGGKVKKAEPKHSKAKDAQRFAKPKGYRWKNEAVTDGIIKKAALSKVPSLYQRKKYPDYVYYEDRTSKSDKSPSRKYKSL